MEPKTFIHKSLWICDVSQCSPVFSDCTECSFHFILKFDPIIPYNLQMAYCLVTCWTICPSDTAECPNSFVFVSTPILMFIHLYNECAFGLLCCGLLCLIPFLFPWSPLFLFSPTFPQFSMHIFFWVFLEPNMRSIWIEWFGANFLKKLDRFMWWTDYEFRLLFTYNLSCGLQHILTL